MKTNIKNLSLLPALIAMLNLIPAGRGAAQTFTTLHSFSAGVYTGYNNYTNSDGAYPGGFILSGNILYGTAGGGGSGGSGTLFALNTNGTGFTILHSFTEAVLSSYLYRNSDGFRPNGLILSGNALYGTAWEGGFGFGTVFALNTDGTGVTNLYGFTPIYSYPQTNSDGFGPNGVILSGNRLYGTAQFAGSSGNGTVFAVNTDGTGFTNLHSFTELDQTYNTNSDGAYPQAGLILSGNTLYGTAYQGGSSGNGTVFSLSLSLSPPEQINNLIALVPSLGFAVGDSEQSDRGTPRRCERAGQRKPPGGLWQPRRFPQRSERANGQEAPGGASRLADCGSHAHPCRARLPLNNSQVR